MRATTAMRNIFTGFLLFAVATDGRRLHKHVQGGASVAGYLNADYTSPYDTLSAEAACVVPLPPQVKAPKKNVWAFLTRTEAREVTKWLAKQKFSNATVFSGAQLMTPNKTAVSECGAGMYL